MKNLVVIILFALLISGCHRPEQSAYDIPERNQLSDSMKNGNYTWVAATLCKLKQAAAADRDSLRWAYYSNEEGAVNFYLGNFNQVLPPSDSAMAWARTYPEKEKLETLQKLSARLHGAYYQQYNFQPDSAIRYQRIALNHTSKSNPADYILALANLADAYKLVAKYPEASELYHQAVLFADSVKADPAQCEMVYSGLAGVYSAMGDFDQAEKWWEKTMNLFPYMDRYAKFANLNNLGNHYYKAQKYRQSLATFTRLENYLDSIGATDWEKNFCQANKADLYIRLDSLDKADSILALIMPFFEEKAPKSVPLSHLHNLQMRLETSRGDIEAVRRLIAAHPLADSVRNEQREGRLTALLDFYKNTGQWKEAFQTQSALSHLKDSIVSQNVQQTLGARRLEYAHNTHMLQLKADNSAKEARIFRLLLILGIALLGVVALAFTVIIVRMRNRNHEERMLKKIIDLRMESVRNRITPHFIYNALNQELLARQKGMESRLPVLVNLLRQQQIIADDVSDSIADELSFMNDYIEVARQRIEQSFQYQEQIDESIDLCNLRIPSMSLQILAENAFKHSFPTLPPNEARRLWVEVVKEENAIAIRVTSNVNPEAPTPSGSSGLGLRIIAETIEYINNRQKQKLQFQAGTEAPGFWTATILILQ